MSWKDIIKNANKTAKNETWRWLGLNFFFIIVPIGCAYLFSFYGKGGILLLDPISHGELSLYSLSLLVSGILILIKGIKITGLDQIRNDNQSNAVNKISQYLSNLSFPGIGVFTILVMIEVVIAVIIFCSSFSQNNTLPNYSKIQTVHIILSTSILVLSMITTFFITLTGASLENSPISAQDIYARSNEPYQRKLDKHVWEE